MIQKRRMLSLAAFSALAAGATLSLALLAQVGGPSLPQDKGPDKLNVSAYPKDIQKDYKIFREKCEQCHTLARPLNTSMSRDAWERYVKRMMHKPNSGISPEQGKKIFEFLVYDQENRKDKNPKEFYPALSDEQIQQMEKGQ